jgi:Uma2 family endonuclease
MAKYIENEVAYYYDSHPTEEDLMGEVLIHRELIHYLADVLKWLFREQVCVVYENINVFQTSEEDEYPIAPDIAVIKDVESLDIISWRAGIYGPAPHVVFEIASDKTWRNDLREKPDEYAQMGVEEYFAYDPHVPTIRRKNPQRLFGWRLNRETNQMVAMPTGKDGRIWSSHLDSFLVPDEKYLRLYDRFGHLRLTGFEAQTIRAEMEAQRANALAEKLRKLGIDPDQD